MRWLFDLARWLAHSTPGRATLHWTFAHMSFVLPVDRLHETDSLLAFYHPRPAYPVHVLIVPKKTYANLMAIPIEDSQLMQEVLQMVQRLVVELGLEESGYRFICNGGPYQDIPHLHFHLISDQPQNA